MLIIILGRVSTEDQAKSGYSLPEQLRSCRQKAEELAKVAGEQATILEFSDDISGDLLERPGLQAALEIVRRQKVDFFVCLDPDRLARRLVLQLLVTEQIETTGCKMEFVQHDYHDTPEGMLFYQLRGAVAEFEKAKIIERMARGARGKIREIGGIPHVLRLYGYHFRVGAGRVPAMQVLTPDPTEAEWVRTIYSWCAGEGLGPHAIAERLNSLGVATKRYGLWAHAQIRRILRNQTYATGSITLNRQNHKGIAVARQMSPEERRKRGLKLSAKLRPEDQWLYVQVEPIVPQALWDEAQQVLDGFRIGARADNHPGRYRMLTGLGKCAECGDSIYYMNGTKMVCYGRYRHHLDPYRIKSECTLPSKPFHKVETAVWEQVRSWIQDPAVLKKALKAEAEQLGPMTDLGAGLRDEMEALAGRIATKQEEQQRVGMLFARNLWPSETAMPALEKIGRELSALQKRLDEVMRQLGSTPSPLTQNPLLALLDDPEYARTIRAELDNIDNKTRIELVRLAVKSYTLYPAGRGLPPKVQVFPR